MNIIIRPAYPPAAVSKGFNPSVAVDEDDESDEEDPSNHDGTLLASGPARPL